MDNSIKKYLEDILHAISDIEMAEERFGRQYDVFENDVIFRKFVNAISKSWEKPLIVF